MHLCRTLTSAGAIALVFLAVFLADAGAAETYRWTDKDGNVGFTDSLERVPPQYRNSAKRMEEKESTKTFQRVPEPPGRNNTMPADQGDPYAGWRQRMTAARAELDKLKVQREKAQAAYDAPLRPTWIPTLRLYPVDPEMEAKASSRIKELDQLIRDKEYEITATIPDEARQAGVPPSVLSQ